MLLLIQPEYPPAVGGMQTHAAALASGLYERGYQIAVVTYSQTDNQKAAAAYDAVQPFPTYRTLSRLSYWNNVKTIRDLAERLQPSMLYSSTPFYGILKAISGIPVVCRSVGNDVMRCWIPYPFKFGSAVLSHPALEQRLYSIYHRLRSPAWLEDLLFSKRRQLVQGAAIASTAVIANSHFTYDRLVELGVDPTAISVVPGGVDAARFGKRSQLTLRGRLGIESAGPVILTVCRLVMKKGVDVLLEATAQARKELPNLALVIVGDGPERQKCEGLALKLGLSDNVHFVGRVAHEEIAAYYHAADYFVLASRIHRRRNGWSDVETMGRVICEANAAGLPVIATNTGGVPTLITHEQNGLLVASDDAPALAAAISKLWRQPGLCRSLSTEGLRRATEEFDWSIIVNEFETIFEHSMESGVAAIR